MDIGICRIGISIVIDGHIHKREVVFFGDSDASMRQYRILDWTYCTDIYIYGKCIYVNRPCSMCFCYRSCVEGQEDSGGQAEGAEALGLVPWENCAVM